MIEYCPCWGDRTPARIEATPPRCGYCASLLRRDGEPEDPTHCRVCMEHSGEKLHPDAIAYTCVQCGRQWV